MERQAHCGKVPTGWMRTFENGVVIASKLAHREDYQGLSNGMCETAERKKYQNEEYKPKLHELKKKAPDEKTSVTSPNFS